MVLLILLLLACLVLAWRPEAVVPTPRPRPSAPEFPRPRPSSRPPADGWRPADVFCTFFDETGNGAVAAGTSTHRRHLLGRFLVRFSKKTCFKLLQAVPSMAISVAESSPEVLGQGVYSEALCVAASLPRFGTAKRTREKSCSACTSSIAVFGLLGSERSCIAWL